MQNSEKHGISTLDETPHHREQLEIFFFRGPPNMKNRVLFFSSAMCVPRLYTLTDTMKAEIFRKFFRRSAHLGSLWTRPKIATFVVFGRSGVKISGNVAYDDRNIVL